MVMMISKRELQRRERQIERLAAAETNVMERLVRTRSDLDVLTLTIDRFLGPPRMHAGGRGSRLTNLVPFRKKG